jgi:hypothetical protein
MKKLLTSLATIAAAALFLASAGLASASSIVDVYNLQPDWGAVGGGGVYSVYYGPNDGYAGDSPGSTAVYLGRAAAPIYAGVNPNTLAADPSTPAGVYEDQGLFAFKPGDVPVATFATQPLTYDFVNQTGVNPVWVYIELNKGATDGSDVMYQYVPTSNPSGWHTEDAATGTHWLKWTNLTDGITTGPMMSLADIAAANPGKTVSRIYLTEGMGNSYNVSPGIGTEAWVDTVTIGGTTYDFVLPPSATTNPATGVSESGATLNGTNGSVAAADTSFWLGTTSAGPFTPSTNPAAELPSGWAGVDSLTQLANAPFSYAYTGLTPSTEYYFVAWSEVDGTWYPGAVLNFTTTTPPPDVTVTIDKFIDGKMATAASANSSAFPMNATWSATNIGSGSGSYNLSTTGFNSANAYEAVTASMTSGASYSTNEVTGGPIVGASCTTGQPYALAGYTTGTSLAAAEAATPSATIPSFSNITQNEVVIVWNKECLSAPVLASPASGTVTTTAGLTGTSWNSVTDPAGGITYVYQSSNSSAQNPDGSFTTPAYTSGALTATNIPTPGTPAGNYWWHVQAKDADGNVSPWSSVWTFTVTNPPPSPILPISCTLTADKTTITRGQAVLLNWTSVNGTSWALTEDTGSVSVPAAGSVSVHPTGTRPYLLSVTEVVPKVGAAFKQCTIQITVNQK